MISNIQVLRAFAALNVVLFHIIIISDSYEIQLHIFDYLRDWGANGVDVFFVISGFVMVHTQYENPKPAYVFMKNRILRIVPLYWSLTLFLGFVLYFFPTAFRSTVFDEQQFILSLLFLTGKFSGAYPVITPGWTLEYEMLFYAIFAICIGFKARVIEGACSLVILMFAILGISDWIVIEFVFGMLVAYAYRLGLWRGQSVLLFLIGCIGLLSSIYFKPDLHRAIVWGVPSAFIVLGTCYLPQTRNRVLIYLGDASYSIYIVQSIALVVYFRLLNYLVPNSNAGDLIALGSLLFTSLVGCCLYAMYERPVTLFLKKWTSHSSSKGAAAEGTEVLYSKETKD